MREIEVIKKDAIEIIEEEELDRLFSEKRNVRVKFGADPTAPDIHLGHTVLLRKLRQFQSLGARVIFIIGDFTARIGDPSGQAEMRPALSKEEVEKNAETYREQVFKILDPKETEILYNSSWLSKMSLEEVLRLSKCYTVARMLERDDFAKRYSKGKPITICEFLYPLLQGYDSVVVNADIEVGGSDQRFNLLLGRAVQQAYGKRPQVIFTMPLLEGTDGKAKMSKSYGNYIGITEPEDAMFGKLMSISDELMIRYYQLLTDEDTEKIERDIKSGKLHPMKAKEELAWKITSLYHSKEAADRALIGFRRVFSERKVPEKILEYQIDRAIRLVSLIYEAGLTESKSEARRLISQGAVSVDGEKIRDMDYLLHPTHSQILKVGKRRFLKVSGAKV